MSRWLFLLSLSALWSAARAELPVDLPADTPTNRPGPGINVPAPLGTDAPTNTVAIPPTPPRPQVRELLQRAEVSVAGDDWLMCTNGDGFAGAFVGYEAGVLHWRVAGHPKTIRFHENGVEGIALAGSVTTNPPAPAGWLVFLADGSVLPARQVTVEGGQVAADLAYAGRVRLERAQVARLRRYDGQHTELVTLADAPAYAPATTPPTNAVGRVRYRETRLPDPLLLEFPWSADRSPAGSIQVFAGKLEDISRYRTTDDLSFSRFGFRMAGAALSGPLTNTAGRPATWVGLAVNRQSGVAVLYLNGRRQDALPLGKKDWTEAGLRVVEDNVGRVVPGLVLVSRINNDLTLPEPPADQEAVRLANDDQLAGRIESLSTNEFVFHAPLGRLALPLERVAQISFGSGTPAAPGAPEFALRDGSRLRGQWQRTDGQSVTIRHAVLGAVTFPRTALAGVDYPVEDAGPDGRNAELSRARMFGQASVAGIPGLIHLANRALWQGDLAGITNGVVRWRHPAALDPLEWPVEQVRRVSPAVRELPAAPAAGRATVRLANGDIISGLLDAGDGDTVRLTPWYAGPLAIPRGQVAHVTPHGPAEGALPLAPSAAETLTDGAIWLSSVRNTPLRSAGPLPDRVRLDMELVWSGWPANVEARFFASPGKQGGPAPEYLNATFAVYGPAGKTIHLSLGGSDGKNSAGAKPFAPPVLANMVAGGSVTLTVLADRAKRHLRLLADGQPAGEWRGTGLAPPTGNDVTVFVNFGADTAIRHAVWREWREDPPPVPAPRPAALAQRTPGDVRVILRSGDFLTLTDIAADERTVTGRHGLLGRIALSAAAVRALDWSLDWTR
jgi:hypothetical protein